MDEDDQRGGAGCRSEPFAVSAGCGRANSTDGSASSEPVGEPERRRGQALIDSTLKPRYIQPPPRKTGLNYLVDLHVRWRGPFFYFCSRYCSPGPRALAPFFESKFARLQCAGESRFNLAYFRHTGQWWEIAQLLSLEECLSEIEAGGLFTP